MYSIFKHTYTYLLFWKTISSLIHHVIVNHGKLLDVYPKTSTLRSLSLLKNFATKRCAREFNYYIGVADQTTKCRWQWIQMLSTPEVIREFQVRWNASWSGRQTHGVFLGSQGGPTKPRVYNIDCPCPLSNNTRHITFVLSTNHEITPRSNQLPRTKVWHTHC